MSVAFMVVAGAVTFASAVVRLEFGNESLDEIALLTQEILQIHAAVWPVVVACLIAVTITSLFLFNRMTEPLLRFTRIFESIRRGEIPDPIELRGRDYLNRETKAHSSTITFARTSHFPQRCRRSEWVKGSTRGVIPSDTCRLPPPPQGRGAPEGVPAVHLVRGVPEATRVAVLISGPRERIIFWFP